MRIKTTDKVKLKTPDHVKVKTLNNILQWLELEPVGLLSCVNFCLEDLRRFSVPGFPEESTCQREKSGGHTLPQPVRNENVWRVAETCNKREVPWWLMEFGRSNISPYCRRDFCFHLFEFLKRCTIGENLKTLYIYIYRLLPQNLRWKMYRNGFKYG